MKDFYSFDNDKERMFILRYFSAFKEISYDNFVVINEFLEKVELSKMRFNDIMAIYTKADPRKITRQNWLKLYHFLQGKAKDEIEDNYKTKIVIYDAFEMENTKKKLN